MACNLNKGKTLHAASNPFGSPATFAVSCWVYPLVQAQQAITGVGDTSSNWTWLALTSTGRVRAYRSSIIWAETPNTYAPQAWNHIYAYFAGNTYREVALNGGVPATSSAPASGGTFVRMWIGDPNTAWHIQAWVAEMAYWDQPLSADERAGLARGISALVVRPRRLIRYWPLLTVESLHCLISGQALLPTGAPTSARHVPVLQPMRPTLLIPEPATGAWWWRQFVLSQAS